MWKRIDGAFRKANFCVTLAFLREPTETPQGKVNARADDFDFQLMTSVMLSFNRGTADSVNHCKTPETFNSQGMIRLNGF